MLSKLLFKWHFVQATIVQFTICLTNFLEFYHCTSGIYSEEMLPIHQRPGGSPLKFVLLEDAKIRPPRGWIHFFMGLGVTGGHKLKSWRLPVAQIHQNQV